MSKRGRIEETFVLLPIGVIKLVVLVSVNNPVPRIAKPQMGWIASAIESGIVIVIGVVTVSAILSAIVAGIFLLLNGLMTVILTRWLDHRDRDDARKQAEREAEQEQVAKAKARSSRKGRPR